MAAAGCASSLPKMGLESSCLSSRIFSTQATPISVAIPNYHGLSLLCSSGSHGTTWNSPISKIVPLCPVSLLADAWSEDRRMRREGVLVDLDSCSSEAEKRSSALRAVKERHRERKYLRSAQDKIEILVKNLCKSDAKPLEVLQNEGKYLNPLDWFNVLEGLGRRRQWLLALEVFRWMQVQNWYTPDNGFYSKLISIMGKERQYTMAMNIFKEVKKTGCRPDTSLYNAVMSVHLRSQDMEKGFGRARDLLEAMKEIRRCQPNVVTYNMLVRSAAQLGQHDVVDQILEEMSRRQISPDNYTFNGIMHAYGTAGDIERMEHILKLMREKRVKPDDVAFNTLIDAYGKAKQFSKMDRALASMSLKRKHQIKPMERTYNSIITHYGNAGQLEGAEAVFEKMKEMKVKPNFITYEVMIGACGRCAEFDKMKRYVKRMKGVGLVPQSSTLNKMLEGYCHHGMLADAEGLLTNSVEMFGVEPSPLSYEIVIRANKKVGKRDEMQAWFEKMRSLNLRPTKQTVGLFRGQTEVEADNAVIEDDETVASTDDEDTLSSFTEMASQNGERVETEESFRSLDELSSLAREEEGGDQFWSIKEHALVTTGSSS